VLKARLWPTADFPNSSHTIVRPFYRPKNNKKLRYR